MDTSHEEDLVRTAFEALGPLGIELLAVRRDGGADRGVDAVVEVARSGRVLRFAVFTKRVVRPSMIAVVADQLENTRTREPVLLVTDPVSLETADLLRSRGIQFVDTAGNAWIDTGAILVAIAGRRPAEPPKPQGDRVTPSTLQVMFVLLRDHHAAKQSVRALGEQAGVSHGAAAMALETLDRRGWVRRLGRHDRRVVDAGGMLASWIQGFVDRLAPKIEIARATSPGLPGPAAWGRTIHPLLPGSAALLGGEAAAEAAGYDLRGESASVYVAAWDAPTMKRLRIVPALDGPISVRSTFAPQMGDEAHPGLVDPLVVLAELSAIPDERLDAARKAVRGAVAARFAT